METSLLPFQGFLCILAFVGISHVVLAQTTNSNVTDFSCSLSSPVCNTYVVYRTQSPGFLNPENVSDLFGVSQLSVTKANNLKAYTEVILIDPDQLLLVPIRCSCTGNQSSFDVPYTIKAGDSFFLVSIHEFENLTNYMAVEALNPTLEPTKLQPGQEVIFPIFCKCPTKTQLEQGFNFLITYVWQDVDNIIEVSKMMNTSINALQVANNHRNFSAAVHHPVLIPLRDLPHLGKLSYDMVAHVEQKTKSNMIITIICLATVGAVLALALGFFLFFSHFKCHRKKIFARTGSGLEYVSLIWRMKTSSTIGSPSPAPMVDKVLPGVSQYLDNMAVYDAGAIMEATSNLDDKFRIGGSVYRATFGGQVLAVKQVMKDDVSEELAILHKVNHSNLVKLAGVSTSTQGDSFLLYEYVQNGTLCEWLRLKPSSSASVSYLSWRQRVNIALDVANGLQYMHEHTRPSIVHGNIRSGTILLNACFKAKISNFSHAKLATVNLTPATDVLAFGILVLELLSGRNSTVSEASDETGILLWRREIRMILDVEEQQKEARLREWMDPNLGGSYSINAALSLAVMAKACTSVVASSRPSMSEIVFSLSFLAQASSTDQFPRQSLSGSDENLQITNPLAAR